MSDPTTTNSAATEVNNVIAASNSLVVQFVESLAIADQSWLGLPGIKQLFGLLLGWLDGYIAQAQEKGLTFAIIDIQVGSEETAYSQALAALKVAQASGNAAAIAAAEKVFINAATALGSDDGSAPS